MLKKFRELGNTTKILIAVIGIPVLVGVSAFGYWTISPLFFDKVVNESLDDAIAAAQNENTNTVDTTDSATSQGDQSPESEPVILKTGNFVDADASHQSAGTANLIELPEGSLILRFEEGFETTNGPDLFVWLTTDGDPDNGYVDLGVLKGNVGAQNYEIPEETDLDDYSTVIIWCRAFSVLFGSAVLVDATSEPEEIMATGLPVEIVSTGEFMDADSSHHASGTANIIALNSETHILRFEEGFETTNGPDLYVWLTVDGDTNKGLVDLGTLKGNIGAQNYTIPEGTDVTAFNTVLIWCKAFNVLFGSAELELVE